jgi:hypothetical protein
MKIYGVKAGEVFDVTTVVAGLEYTVYSKKSGYTYQVKRFGTGWWCDCPNAEFRNHGNCKHIQAVMVAIKHRNTTEVLPRVRMNTLLSQTVRQLEEVGRTLGHLTEAIQKLA